MTYKIGIYPEWWDSIEKLSLEDKGKILENIFYYSTKGEIPHNSYIEVIFNFMKNRIDADKKKYDEKCISNKDNIQKYWNDKKEIQTNTNVYERITDDIQTITNSKSNSISISKYNIKEMIGEENLNDFLPPQELDKFINYRSETIQNGKNKGKEKRTSEKTWDTKKRMIKWKTNYETNFGKIVKPRTDEERIQLFYDIKKKGELVGKYEAELGSKRYDMIFKEAKQRLYNEALNI